MTPGQTKLFSFPWAQHHPPFPASSSLVLSFQHSHRSRFPSSSSLVLSSQHLPFSTFSRFSVFFSLPPRALSLSLSLSLSLARSLSLPPSLSLSRTHTLCRTSCTAHIHFHDQACPLASAPIGKRARICLRICASARASARLHVCTLARRTHPQAWTRARANEHVHACTCACADMHAREPASKRESRRRGTCRQCVHGSLAGRSTGHADSLCLHQTREDECHARAIKSGVSARGGGIAP